MSNCLLQSRTIIFAVGIKYSARGPLFDANNYAWLAIYTVAQNVSHCQMIKKSYQVVLKPVN